MPVDKGPQVNLSKIFEKQAAIKKRWGRQRFCQKNISCNVSLCISNCSFVSPRLLALRAAGLVGKTANVAWALS
jgi:hypothetical protein